MSSRKSAEKYLLKKTKKTMLPIKVGWLIQWLNIAVPGVLHLPSPPFSVFFWRYFGKGFISFHSLLSLPGRLEFWLPHLNRLWSDSAKLCPRNNRAGQFQSRKPEPGWWDSTGAQEPFQTKSCRYNLVQMYQKTCYLYISVPDNTSTPHSLCKRKV